MLVCRGLISRLRERAGCGSRVWFSLGGMEYGERIQLDQVHGKLIVLVITLGTGTGRAAGLGHVFLEPSPLGFGAGGVEGEADATSGQAGVRPP